MPTILFTITLKNQKDNTATPKKDAIKIISIMKQEAKEKQKKNFLLKDHQDVIELIYM